MSGIFNSAIFNNAIFNSEEAAALEWPATVMPYSFDFFLRPNSAALVSPVTRKSQRLTFQGELWIGSAAIVLDREDSQDFDAFLDAAQGGATSFLLWDFTRPEPLGVNQGDVTVLGTAAAGDMSFTTEGWDAGIDGQLLAGDCIGVDGYLYRLAQDANSDGSGEATLQLTAPLKSRLTAGMAVTRSKPTVPVRLSSMKSDKSLLVNHYEVEFEEAW